MVITRTSQLTGIEHSKDLPISQEQLNDFSAGNYVQDAFPNLPAHDREFILTGITQEEWDYAFPLENDE